jgi:hypothetical protein
MFTRSKRVVNRSLKIWLNGSIESRGTVNLEPVTIIENCQSATPVNRPVGTRLSEPEHKIEISTFFLYFPSKQTNKKSKNQRNSAMGINP